MASTNEIAQALADEITESGDPLYEDLNPFGGVEQEDPAIFTNPLYQEVFSFRISYSSNEIYDIYVARVH